MSKIVKPVAVTAGPVIRATPLVSAIRAAIGDKNAALETVINALENVVEQILLHGNKTALAGAVTEVQGKKGRKELAVMAALQVVVALDLKVFKAPKDEVRGRADDIGADAMAALVAAWPFPVALSDADKKTKKAESDVRKEKAAIELAGELGFIDPATLPKAQTLRDAVGSMTKAELQDLAHLVDVQLALFATVEKIEKENAALALSAMAAEKIHAAESDAAARRDNAANVAKPAIVESLTALV